MDAERDQNVAREAAAPTAPKEPPDEPPLGAETHEGPIVADRDVPPTRSTSPMEWMRENLFSSRWNGLLTVVFGLLIAWSAYRAGRFVFVSGRWEIIRRNLLLFMVFRFPRDGLWRLWVAAFVVAAGIGFATGVAASARAAASEDTHIPPPSLRLTARRLAPVALLIAVLLVLVGTATPVLLAVGVIVVAAAGNLVGRRVPARFSRVGPLIGLAAVVAGYATISQFGGAGYAAWGGLLLTLFLAVGGIVLSFPFGVLLALGRRSTLPAVRVVCVTYIELIRGVPLITLLFLGALVIGLFFPPATPSPESVTRALIAIVLFTAAYVAEIVRGGLQSVPHGQVEAAQALGLSPVTTTRRIVLPQALRNVIPALVGQFISLFKDTSLVTIIGLTELLSVAQIVTKQPDFIAQGLMTESLVFAAFVYWVGSYTMSRESQRLERRLGLGER